MKITQGFVAATPDGQFLHIGVIQTHVGDRVHVSVVPDIEQATVSTYAGHYASRHHDNRAEFEKHKITWVPVEVRREVILKGYGNGSA